MPMYNLIAHSDNYRKSTLRFKTNAQEKNQIVLTTNSARFKYKCKFPGSTPGNDTVKVVLISAPFKNLSNCWRTLEMPIINCQIDLGITWNSTFIFVRGNYGFSTTTFAVTVTKLFAPVLFCFYVIWLPQDQGSSLTNPVLITVFTHFNPRVTRILVMQLGPKAKPSNRWGLNRKPSDSESNVLIH